MTKQMTSYSRNRLAPLFLGVLTFLIYGQVFWHEFQLYDVYDYILNNPIIRSGISWNGVLYAFTTVDTGDWQPLTWISWMMDCSFFGLNPGLHHLMNVLIHLASGILLFNLLRRITGAFWRSWFVAAFFLLHPLHVESVAWIAERKDTLSALFWFWSLLAYQDYVKTSSRKAFWISVSAMAFGVMSKPMIVTLPLTLLLLDFWPLKRTWSLKLIYEKIPYYLLAKLSIGATLFANTKAGGHYSLEDYSVWIRTTNAFHSYIQYLIKTFWPVNLAVFYPHPKDSLHPIAIGVSILIFLALTVAAIRFRKSLPYLFFGWFWYVVTLLPVIGLIQVGSQAMADRYTYIPLIGIFIILVWGGEGCYRIFPPVGKLAIRFLGLIFLIGFSAVSWKQIGYWKNDILLNQHAIQVTQNNFVAHANLGFYYELKGKTDEAISEYLKSLEINAKNPDVLNNLANLLLAKGKVSDAMILYHRVLLLKANHPAARKNFDSMLASHSSFDLYQMANRAVEQQDWTLAEIIYGRALEMDPGNAHILHNLGSVYFQLRNYQKAKDLYEKAIAIDPYFQSAKDNLRKTLSRMI